MALTIGIDLGGTKTLIGLVDNFGNIVAKTLMRTPVDAEPDDAIDFIIDGIKHLSSNNTIQAIGIGIAGQISKETGVVYNAPNLPKWINVPLKQKIHQILDVPVAVTNDVRAAAWGEWLFGAGRNSSDIVCLFVGTGIGGGVVCAGQMLEGTTNVAGELGHITIDLNGPICSCGNRGCFEAIASGWAIAKRIKTLASQDLPNRQQLLNTLTCQIEDLDARMVFIAAEQELSLAVQVVKEVEAALIAGIIGVIHSFNPERFILGGGVIDGHPYLIDVIRKGVYQHALKASVANLEILPAQLGVLAGVIGAASYARKFLG